MIDAKMRERFKKVYGSPSEIANEYAKILNIEKYDIRKIVSGVLCITCNFEYYNVLKFKNSKVAESYKRYGFITYAVVLDEYMILSSMFSSREHERLSRDEINLISCTIAALQVDEWQGDI